MKKDCFLPADILLPDFDVTDGTLWSVVACDQYTSQPEYWACADTLVGANPSTLRTVLPEVYLSEADIRIPPIRETMFDYLDRILVCHPDSMILVDRTLADGKHRYGLVGRLDLESYDFRPGSDALTRATEETVPERIPPRMIIRRGAPMELPHAMLLIDDRAKTVVEPLFARLNDYKTVYDHDLMQNSGHLKGYLLDATAMDATTDALAALITPDAMAERYGKTGLAPLLFAVGDGNHSLAAAKSCYEELKAKLGAEAVREHPMRYALCEVVNIFDDSLDFEPIYRTIVGIDPQKVAADFEAYCASLSGLAAAQEVRICFKGVDKTVIVPHPVASLAVGTVQAFLNSYPLPSSAVVDYIHGEDVAVSIGTREGAIAFLFDGMTKEELFSTVIADGSLPRKTFSMGHASDKRFYTEARRLG